MMLGRRPLGLVPVSAIARRLSAGSLNAGAAIEAGQATARALALRAEAGGMADGLARVLAAAAQGQERASSDAVAQGQSQALGGVFEAGAANAISAAAAAAVTARQETADLRAAEQPLSLALAGAAEAVAFAAEAGSASAVAVERQEVGGALEGGIAALSVPAALPDAATLGQEAGAGLAGGAEAFEFVAIADARSGGLWLGAEALEAGTGEAAASELASVGAASLSLADATDTAFGTAMALASTEEPAAAVGSVGLLVAAVAAAEETAGLDTLGEASLAGSEANAEVGAALAAMAGRMVATCGAGSELQAASASAATARAVAGQGEPCAGRDSAGPQLAATARAAESGSMLDRLNGLLSVVEGLADEGAAQAVQFAGLIWRRTFELLARLNGPVLLPARLPGPAVLAGRIDGPLLLPGRLGGMAITHQEREVIMGDGYVFRFPVDIGPGVPADLSGAKTEFGYGLSPDARENANRPSAATQIASTEIRGKNYPTVETSIPASETASLKPRTVYHYACRVTRPGQEPQTIALGTFRTAPAPL